MQHVTTRHTRELLELVSHCHRPCSAQEFAFCGSQAIVLLFTAWFAAAKAKENVQVVEVRLLGAGPQGPPSCAD